MNKLIDWILTFFKYIIIKTKLYLVTFYNKIYFTINRNFTLSTIYKPIIEEKTNKNKELQQSLNLLNHRNKEVKSNILKIEKENAFLQSKITIIQDIVTKRHD